MTYTVMYCTNDSDIPLKIFDDPANANDYAESIAEHEANDAEPDVHDDVAEAYELLSREASPYCHMAIAHHDYAGKLVEWDVLDGDDDETQEIEADQPAAA
jgi:hypothetical protein